MTTPAQDAPLVFPSVAFRPVRLFVISSCADRRRGRNRCLARQSDGRLCSSASGLLLGLLNALGVQRSVAAITAEAHPLKKKMALNSATRLLVITTIGLAIAFVFRPAGLGVVFGLALFQVLLVLTTALPVMKKLRTGTADAIEGTGHSND